MTQDTVLGAILRVLGRALQLLVGFGLFIGLPALAIWQSDWIALASWAGVMLVFIGMAAGPLPSMRGF